MPGQPNEPENEFEGDELEDTSGFVSGRRKHKDYVQGYSNFAECGTTPWDIRLLFSLTSEEGTRKIASIAMTPPMAKALSALLNTNIKVWEQQNGEIKMPESLARERDAQRAKAKADAQAGIKTQAEAQAEPEVAK